MKTPCLERGENSIKVPLIKGDLGGSSLPQRDLGGSPEVATRPDLVWREGVLLTDGYATAEVIENYHQREICIRVAGNVKRDLLNCIRYELWKIHSSYDNRLQFQEFIPCNCAKCQGSNSPHAYPFDVLQQFYRDRQYEIQCQKSYQMVNVRGLIDDFPDYSQSRDRAFSGINGSKLVEPPSSPQIVYNLTLGNNKMTQDSSQTNNLQGAQIGNFANEVKDSAQQTASHLTQINNANTAELLQLVASLRQAAEQFPEDIREDIIIDIEDVETEIQKPETDRNPKRLKKSLSAILAAATATGVAIAGTVDFANNVVDLGQKVGVELTLPSAR